MEDFTKEELVKITTLCEDKIEHIEKFIDWYPKDENWNDEIKKEKVKLQTIINKVLHEQI